MQLEIIMMFFSYFCTLRCFASKKYASFIKFEEGSIRNLNLVWLGQKYYFSMFFFLNNLQKQNTNIIC